MQADPGKDARPGRPVPVVEQNGPYVVGLDEALELSDSSGRRVIQVLDDPRQVGSVAEPDVDVTAGKPHVVRRLSLPEQPGIADVGYHNDDLVARQVPLVELVREMKAGTELCV